MRIAIGLRIVLVLLMIYVMLTANLTALNYAVSNASTSELPCKRRAALDDRIAALRLDDRLSGVAARLGMREPQRFAIVETRPPAVADARPHVAVLSSLAGFLMPPAVARQR